MGGIGRRGGILPFLYYHCLEKAYIQPFSVVIIIRAMNILFPWNLNILYIIYYLSPKAFGYIVYAHLLDTECEGPCLIA